MSDVDLERGYEPSRGAPDPRKEIEDLRADLAEANARADDAESDAAAYFNDLADIAGPVEVADEDRDAVAPYLRAEDVERAARSRATVRTAKGVREENDRLRARLAECEARTSRAPNGLTRAVRAYVDAEDRERKAFRAADADELFCAQLARAGRFAEMLDALAQAEKYPPEDTDRTKMVRRFLSEVTPEQERLDRPGLPSPTTLRFRVRLVLDEVAEMLDELYDDRAAVDQLRACFSWFLDVSNWRRELYRGKGLAKVAREATDVAYAVEGLLATCGVDGTAIFRLVDAANLAKKGAERDASGKIQKPQGWIAPDVEGELRRQGWKG